MNRSQLFWLVTSLIIIGALMVRLYLATLGGYENDLDQFRYWIGFMTKYGWQRFYESGTDYPPLFAYLFSPAVALGQSSLPNLALKLPTILADLGIGLTLLLTVRQLNSPFLAIAAAAFYLFNPAILFGGALWGQLDSVMALLILLSLVALLYERPVTAWATMTIAILMKAQSLIFLPILLVITFRKHLSSLFPAIMIGLMIFALAILPFIMSEAGNLVWQSYFGSVDRYPLASMNAFNLWWVVTAGNGRAISDTTQLLGLSYKFWGLTLFGAGYLVMLYKIFRQPTTVAIGLSMILTILMFFMLPTQIHERYLLPLLAIIPLFFTTLEISLYGLFFSLTLFFNLVYSFATVYQLPPPLHAIASAIEPYTVYIALANLFLFGLFFADYWLVINQPELKPVDQVPTQQAARLDRLAGKILDQPWQRDEG